MNNKIDISIGLSEEQVKNFQIKNGFNEMPDSQKQGFLKLLFKVLSEPMLLLLVISSLIYFLMGSIDEALMLCSFVIVVIGITFYQEYKTENTLHKLKNLASPRALVIRNGQKIVVPGREIVCGDLVILQEGDRIPADVVVLNSINLSVDESLLTGESLSVSKISWDGQSQAEKPGGDNTAFAYSGTMVLSGHAIAQVFSTGANTQMGKIGKSLQQIREEDTLIKKEIKSLSKYFLGIGAILCLFILFFYFLRNGNLIDGFLYGLAVSMSMLPEEFPVVFVIFMTLGAWRLAKYNVLTRNPSAIETLGAATVLCVDKTGTLTKNQMKLGAVYFNNTLMPFNENDLEKAEDIISISHSASRIDSNDPIEKEIVRIFKNYSGENQYQKNLVKEYHLAKDLLVLSHVWDGGDGYYSICSKGAPEAIINISNLEKKEKEGVLNIVKEMSDKGYRVIGVAKAEFDKSLKLPDHQKDFKYEFVGLLGFIDPIKDSVIASLKEAYDAKIRVIMITGDYPGTAKFVAKEIGLKNNDCFLIGSQIEKLTDEQLEDEVMKTNIFARVLPEQKLRIVRALKKNGEIVAMTGDGINDAPALKSAHIGIAMGQRGTDVAREASSLVLLDDDFCSIVSAVKQGRTIFGNLRKAISYIFAIHIPIAGMAFLPIVFGFPMILMPAHIAFLELIIDPACSAVYEGLPPEKDVMEKPPRKLKEKLFDSKLIGFAFLQGMIALSIIFLSYYFLLNIDHNVGKTKTIIFLSLVISNLILIIINLSWSKNIFGRWPKALWIILVSVFLSLYFSLSNVFLRNIFDFDILNMRDILLSILIGFAILVLFEIIKNFKIIKNTI